MSKTQVVNAGIEPITLCHPYNCILGPGHNVVIADTVANVLAYLDGGISAAIMGNSVRVKEVSSDYATTMAAAGSVKGYAVVGTIAKVGAANDAGVATTVARGDHAHTIDTGVVTNAMLASGVAAANIAGGTITGKLTVSSLLSTDMGLTVNTTPVAGAALGTVRAIIGSVAVSNTAVASGTVAGIRGIVTLTGSIASGPTYLYGSQGKAVLDGVTLAAGSGHVCATLAQMSASGTTVTNGHVAPLIVSGQNLPTSANVNMIYCESGGGTVNAVLQSNVKSTYIFDFNNFEGGGNIAAAGTATGSAGDTAHCRANRVLVCLVDGSAGFIPIFNSNA